MMTADNSANGRVDKDEVSIPPELRPVVKAIADQSLPPVDKWMPTRLIKIPMRIGRDGQWYYQGTPIPRPALVRLFASVLRREPDGDIYLVTPGEKYQIDIDDAPFVAKELTVSGSGEDQVLAMRTNMDEYVIISEDNALFMDDGGPSVGASPYVHVRGGMNALVSRPVYYELVDLAVPSAADPNVMGVYSKGGFFSLGTVTA
ncbi:MAG: DUF1285 domain-containing protein [Pseudomonadota bacterium]